MLALAVIEAELAKLSKPRDDLRPLHMGMLEREHGTRFIAWRDDMVRLHGDSVPGLADLHHIPNGGKRDKAVAKQLKAEGLTPGVSDYFLPMPIGRYHGLYLELKRPQGRPTSEQLEWLGRMNGRGYGAVVAWDWRQAGAAVLSYYLGVGPFVPVAADA